AAAAAQGRREAVGAALTLHQGRGVAREEALDRTGAKAARQQFAHIPIIEPDQLAEAEAILFGTPTRFGNMAAQMRNFLDRTGGLWMKGSLVGKVGSVFCSTGTQHGGQETTITSFHTTLLHHGFVIVGVPYTCPELVNMNEIT